MGISWWNVSMWSILHGGIAFMFFGDIKCAIIVLFFVFVFVAFADWYFFCRDRKI